MFRTIRAQYATSICKRCRQPIAVGQRMRYGGPGRTYHLRADCPAGENDQREAGETTAERSIRQNGGDPRAEFGFDGRQMGYCPSDDGGDW